MNSLSFVRPSVSPAEFEALISVTVEIPQAVTAPQILKALGRQRELSPCFVVWMRKSVQQATQEEWYQEWNSSVRSDVGSSTLSSSDKSVRSSLTDKMGNFCSLSDSGRNLLRSGSFLKQRKSKHFIRRHPIFLSYYVLVGGNMGMASKQGSTEMLAERFPHWKNILIEGESPHEIWMKWWDLYPVEAILLGKILIPTDKTSDVYLKRLRIIDIAARYGMQIRKEDLSESVLIALIDYMRRIRKCSPSLANLLVPRYKSYLDQFNGLKGISDEVHDQIFIAFPGYGM